MSEALFAELSAWLTQAGLAGTSEPDIVSGFCDRCVTAGLPLARSLIFIDTLHPIHEGRLFRWGYGPTEAPLVEYGRTSPDALARRIRPGSESRAVRRCSGLAWRICNSASRLRRRPQSDARVASARSWDRSGPRFYCS